MEIEFHSWNKSCRKFCSGMVGVYLHNVGKCIAVFSNIAFIVWTVNCCEDARILLIGSIA